MHMDSRFVTLFAIFAGAVVLPSCGDETLQPSGGAPSLPEQSSALSSALGPHAHIQRPPTPSAAGAQNRSVISSNCKLPAHLTRQGGANATAVTVVPVFWGINVDATIQSSISTSLNVMQFSALDSWVTKEYAMPHMTHSAPITISPQNPLGFLTDGAIQSELNFQITHGVLPGADSSHLYVVFLPPNETVDGGCTVFCGYNGAFNGTSGPVYYSVIPDFSTGTCTGCVSTSVRYDSVTAVATHEIFEALTDEMGGGWEDLSQDNAACGVQIADLCARFDFSTSVNPIGSAMLHMMWSNTGNTCRQSSPGSRNDINGDGFGDFALVAGPGWTTIPVGFYSGPTAAVTTVNDFVSNFPGWAAIGKTVMGDFNGDGLADLAVTGVSGWTSLPVAFSTGIDGLFNVTNQSILNFAEWAAAANVLLPAAGDFDGDGLADIALAGATGWTTLPVAYSKGDGSFTVTNVGNSSSTTFDSLIQNSRLRPTLLTGDFDGDGRTDLALVGGTNSSGAAWTTIPIAFATATRGAFNLVQKTVANFPTWATQHAYAVAGDFDGDGRSDIALTGAPTWSTVPIAYSNGDGTFAVTNFGYGTFPSLAKASSVRVMAGDYDGDGLSDIMLFGATQTTNATILAPLGRTGSFAVTSPNVSTLSGFAAQSLNVKAIGVSYAYAPGGP